MKTKLFLLFIISLIITPAWSQAIHYKISIPQPATQQYQVDLHLKGWNADTVVLKMPNWMPGYYQIMDYGKAVQNINVTDEKGKALPFQRINHYTVVMKREVERICFG